MEEIKQWALSICAAMVACGLAQMLLPRCSMEKVFRLTVSVFFLCCLLSPVLLRNTQLRIEWEEYAQQDIERRADSLYSTAQSQAEGAAGRELEKIIGEKLAQTGIKYHGVTINMNTNGQSAQADLEAEIVVDRKHQQDHARIRTELEEQLGMTVRIVYAGEDTEEG